MTPHRPTQDFFASNGVSDRQQQPEPLGTGVDGRPANAEAKSSALLRTEQPMNRRRLLKAAGASLAGAVFGTSIATGLRPISARAAGVSAVPFRVYDSRNSAVTPGPLTEAGSPYRIFSGFLYGHTNCDRLVRQWLHLRRAKWQWGSKPLFDVGLFQRIADWRILLRLQLQADKDIDQLLF